MASEERLGVEGAFGMRRLLLELLSFGFLGSFGAGLSRLIFLYRRGNRGTFGSHFFWINALYELIGFGILGHAAYLTAQRLKYGGSVLDLQTVPIVPGGILAGTVRLSRPLLYRHPIHLPVQFGPVTGVRGNTAANGDTRSTTLYSAMAGQL